LDNSKEYLQQLAAKLAATFQSARVNKWAVQTPTERQQLFLSVNHVREAFYGGAAGGGKSSCLLMAALEFVDVPGYSALLLRKNFADLNKPGALMSRAHEWLYGTGAKWNEGKHQWTFPSGATLTFGYLETENDKYQYLGAEYQFIGFDEVTQFTESSYTYLFSRLRRLAGSDIPLRVRAASNPGGPGARWVYARFIPEGFSPADAEEAKVFWKEANDVEGEEMKRAFIPAKLQDNPHLDQQEYIESLRSVDPITREQMLRGDWQISERGDIYPMWSELHHVITWSQFQKFYSLPYRGIPSHWLRGIFMDCGTTEGHPNVTSWIATAPENTKLSGVPFLYRGQCTYNKTVRELAEHILTVSTPEERSRTTHWRMSHEASSERISFNRDFGLPFSNWKADRNRGIAQIRNYLEIRNKELPHPFKPEVKGRPSFYLIVDDDQILNPKDDDGLERWRAEFPAYHYKTQSGGVATQVMPHPLFNDAMDTVRAAGAEYFSPALPLTSEELIQAEMAQMFSGRTFDDVLALPPEQRGPAIDAWRMKERDVRDKVKNRRITHGLVKWKKRKRG
jgi:hypothetical protein